MAQSNGRRSARRRKRWLAVMAGLAGVGGLLSLAARPRWLTRLIHRSTAVDVYFHFEVQQPLVALTIDDGPHPEITPQILDVLREHQVNATFFVIGERVVGNEELLERMIDEGHELGNHLWRDERSIQLDTRTFEQHLLATEHILRPFSVVNWARPGSGFYNTDMLNTLRQHGYKLALGSVYPYDAQVPTVEFASRYIASNTEPGSIVVLHDGSAERYKTIDVLQRIIPELKAGGFEFVTLSELAQEAEEN